MKELLGNHLSHFFHNTNTRAKNTYKGKDYEVWEVSDNTFKEMCDMSEEFFIEWGGDDAWWDYSEGTNIKSPIGKAIVNGEWLRCWDDVIRIGINSYMKFESLTEYLYKHMCNLRPQSKYICAYVTDLAKYNNMSMGELFRKYEG